MIGNGVQDSHYDDALLERIRVACIATNDEAERDRCVARLIAEEEAMRRAARIAANNGNKDLDRSTMPAVFPMWHSLRQPDLLGPAVSTNVFSQPVQNQQQQQQQQTKQPLQSLQSSLLLSQNRFSKEQQEAMSQLPPHLRQYVDQTYVPPPPDAQNLAQAASEPLPTGPKPWYDWRRTDDTCKQVGARQNPGSVAWSDPRHAPEDRFEYIDQPQVKLTRTFGSDGKKLNVQGNTVHHATVPPLSRAYPVNGREANNFLRRMTGHDPHRKARAAVLNPTLLPDLPEGVVPGGGRFLTDRERDTNAALNPDTIGDYMLPFIRPDLHQWTERPVSYKKPTLPVTEPIIPDTRAGWWKEANEIGTRLGYDDALPILIGNGDACGRGGHVAISGDRHDVHIERMPREATHRSILKADVTTEAPAPLRADVELPIPKGMEPKTYTAIKTVHKKLQQPHSLAYGAAYAASDEADYDPTGGSMRFAADLSGERRRPRASNVTTGLKAHGAAYEEEIGSSVLPSTGSGRPADALSRTAMRQSRVASGLNNPRGAICDDEQIGEAADGAQTSTRARASEPLMQRAAQIETAPIHQIYRAQTDADVEAGNHGDSAGGVRVRRPGTERAPIDRSSLRTDDLENDSARQYSGVSVRETDDQHQQRVQTRERQQQQNRAERLARLSLADALDMGAEGALGDSAAYGALSHQSRAPARDALGQRRERNAAPSQHGARSITTRGGGDDEEDVLGARGGLVGADPTHVRAGAMRERRRLESSDLRRANAETGVELELRGESTLGTMAHRSAARADSMRVRERNATSGGAYACRPRITDERFEDNSSALQSVAAPVAGDRAHRIEQLERRRIALQAEIQENLARRRTIDDEDYSQAEHLRGPGNTNVSARPNALREHSKTRAAQQSGSLVSDDLLDAPHQPVRTDAWRSETPGQRREADMQRKREDLWREVLSNDDGDGIADHLSVGSVRARGDGDGRDQQRLDARTVARIDGLATDAAGDFNMGPGVGGGAALRVTEQERGQRSARLERLRGIEAHRLQVESLGGDGEGVADNAASSVGMGAGKLREMHTRRGVAREGVLKTRGPIRADAMDDVYEAGYREEGMATQGHRRDRAWRDEMQMARTMNPDSDVLDAPIFSGSGVGTRAEQPIVRQMLRERRGLDAPTKGRLDDLETKFVEYTLDPGTIRCDKNMVRVKEEQRAFAMRNRLRADTPPPENILRTNARFRAMNSGGKFARGKPETPPGSPQRARRCDSPVYKSARVCPF